ncbi:polysaccharide deacetylase family protein [Streptomyces sp. NBC_01589]|uniref:polysaccharide deacetylase family protein n=1 Tax=Streptomyces sp. NBC_01589 TaxID=2975886 RepID=UPI00386EF1F1
MTAVKGLLLRLSALEADAATAVRVIAHFEALLGGGLDPVSLTRSTAALAGCAAGLELPDGRAARFGSAGVALPGPPERVSGRVDLEPSGRVWLERPGEPGPFDELVLEWMAITARVLAGRPRQTRVPSAADPALVELVLSGREDASDRARALRLLGLDPEAPLRVAAVAGGPGTDVGVEAVALLGRGSLHGIVRVAQVGPVGAVLVQRPIGYLAGSAPGDGPSGRTASPAAELRTALRERLRDRGPSHRSAHAIRVGVGGGADPLDARDSWAQARSALRFAGTGTPEEAVADHDELGPVALLADIPVERLRAQVVDSTRHGGRAVALTFDDGPNPADTPRLLEVLRKRHVTAVFCLWGDHVKEHPELVRAMVAGGHTLCNHTMHHDDMGTWSAEDIRADLERTNAEIRRAAPGARIPYFRAPYGNWGKTSQVAADLGMQPLGWRLAIGDWEPPGADELVRRVEEGITPGAVILMHDGGGDRSQTVEAVDRLIPLLRAEGWHFDKPARCG